MDLQWTPFFVLTGSLVAVRLAARRYLPIAEVSTVNGAFLGIVFFLGIPCLAYGGEMAIGPWLWAGWVAGTAVTFLACSALVRGLLKPKASPATAGNATKRAFAVATTVALLYVSSRLVVFFAAGGFSQARATLFSGTAHLEYVSSLGEDNTHAAADGLRAAILMLLEYAFYSSWAVLGRKRRLLAAVSWIAVALSFSIGYSGRSAMARFLIIPYLAYLELKRPKARTISLQFGVLSVFLLVTFSWNSASRLGQEYGLELQQVIADTLRDSGNSGPAAVALHTEGYSESARDYLASLAGFAVPRAIWPTKPVLQTNVVATERLTGRDVGRGTSIITTTIVGEGWLHFGQFGPFLIGGLFGLAAGAVDGILLRHPLGGGIRYALSYLAGILVRSTFMSFFQAASVALVAFFLMRLAAGARNGQRLRRRARGRQREVRRVSHDMDFDTPVSRRGATR